jgi:hypothetical protein
MNVEGAEGAQGRILKPFWNVCFLNGQYLCPVQTTQLENEAARKTRRDHAPSFYPRIHSEILRQKADSLTRFPSPVSIHRLRNE